MIDATQKMRRDCCSVPAVIMLLARLPRIDADAPEMRRDGRPPEPPQIAGQAGTAHGSCWVRGCRQSGAARTNVEAPSICNRKIGRTGYIALIRGAHGAYGRAWPSGVVLQHATRAALSYAYASWLPFVTEKDRVEGTVLPVVVTLIGTVWGFFIHANLRWRFGPLEYLVATPAFHHWHHTRSKPINRNYSAVMPWLDRLFGTYYLPDNQWPTEYGIKAKLPESLVGQLIYPLVAPPPTANSSIVEPRPAESGGKDRGCD
ncbi:MAG TPA: sterol desaturase family protein [Pirellulales bacterium]|nr:sterol desaturase family protein [Pirellulales bacterium]